MFGRDLGRFRARAALIDVGQVDILAGRFLNRVRGLGGSPASPAAGEETVMTDLRSRPAGRVPARSPDPLAA